MLARHWRLIAISFLFSFTLNLPFLCEYQRYGSQSVLSFNDIDEPNYLRLPFIVATGFAPESYYLEHRVSQPLLDTLSGHPNRALDLIVGKMALAFQLTPIELGLLLDLLCGSLGFTFGFLVLRRFTNSNISAFTGTVVLLAFPWLFWIGNYYTYDWGSGSALASSLPSPLSVHFYPRVPIFRALYTQVSVVLFFALLLGCLGNAGSKSKISPQALALGALAGSGIYVYFFGWVACLIFAPLILLIRDRKGGAWSVQFKELGLFIVGAMLVSAPGLATLATSQNPEAQALAKLRDYWFLPLEYLAIALLSGLLAFISNPHGKKRTILLLLTAIPLIDILFSNLQPLLQMWLEPHHLGKYFLWPMYSGLLCTLLIDIAHEYGGRSLSLFLPACVGVGVLVVVALYEGELEKKNATRTRLTELLVFLEAHVPKNAVIGAYPFLEKPSIEGVPALSNLATIISTLQGNPIFLQYTNSWLSKLPLSEMLDRERITSWLYFDNLSLIPPCGTTKIVLPGDLFSFTTSLRSLAREVLCSKEEVPQTKDFCDLTGRYQIDFVISTEAIPVAVPRRRNFELIWTSSDHQLELFRVLKWHSNSECGEVGF